MSLKTGLKFLFLIMLPLLFESPIFAEGTKKSLAKSKGKGPLHKNVKIEIDKTLGTRYYKIPYTIKKRDRFATILRQFVKKTSVINRKTPMIEKTIRSNRHIRNWKKLPAGETITLYISPEFMDLNKFNFDPETAEKEYTDTIAKIRAPGESPYKFSVFYMASYGKFTQSNPAYAKVEFMQNSPVSLGGMAAYAPKDSLYSISTSLYYSYLEAASSNISSQNIQIPGEIGGNVYVQHYFNRYDFNLYGGLDYEKFNTFNLVSIQQEHKITIERNSVVYATLGVTKVLKVFGKKFLTKFSISQSVTTSSTGTELYQNVPKKYSGMKLLWYVNKKISKDWFVHTLLKYHFMSGPTDLTTLRMGVGVGYIIK